MTPLGSTYYLTTWRSVLAAHQSRLCAQYHADEHLDEHIGCVHQSFDKKRHTVNLNITAGTLLRDAVTKVKCHSAFSDCTKTQVKLPKSITSVGDMAFGVDGLGESLCAQVLIPASNFTAIENKVIDSQYDENRIEQYQD